MTVILALCCQNGVVIASDSQGTEGGGLDVRHPVQKLFPLMDNIAWGSSGSGAVIADIRQKLEASADVLAKSPKLSNSLGSLIQPILKAHYDRYVHIPGTAPNPPATSTLFAGFTQAGEPWLLEVDPNCTVTDYTDEGKHAIGSGGGFAYMANALMSHYPLTDRPVDWGKAVAYRAINAVIRTSSAHVGPPVQMGTVTQDGCTRVNDEELKQLDEFVGGWQAIEVESLETLMTPKAEEPAPLPAELPAEFNKPAD